MKWFYIGDRFVWDETEPLVIAEIGINHWWSIKIAKEMVDSAHKAWAEIIKHQTHIIDDEMSNEAKKVIPWNAKESIYDIMKKCALSEESEYELMSYVKSKWMIFISTPFSRKAANRLNRFNIPAYKIWSWECNNYPLIEHIVSFWKPIILSTWMNSIESIRKAVEIIRKWNIPYALLHCTNVYPTPYELVRLWALDELKKEFPDALIWLSDHTESNYSCLWAVVLWACILERHFTDTKTRIWPDISCSMDEKNLKELIIWSKILFKCRWGKKWPVEAEKSCINFAFSTVVTIKNIKQWEEFTKENIWVKRPWTGEIKAEFYNDVLWKISNKDLNQWTHLLYKNML